MRITADNEISVSTLNQGSCSVYKAIPTDALGTQYYVTTGQPVLADQSANVAVRATQDATTVSVTFPPNRGINFFYNGRTYRAGDTLDVTLNQDQTFSIKDTTDLTGTCIKATKPVGVWGGNGRVSFGTIISTDSVVSQFPSTNTWGRRFTLVRQPNDLVGGTVKALALQDQTRITVKGVVQNSPLNQVTQLVNSVTTGAVFTFQAVAGASLAIESDKPIMVVYYSNGDNSNNRPVSLLLPPVEQYMNLYTFSPPTQDTNGRQYTNYLLVAIEKGKESGLLLGNTLVPNQGWLDLPTPWSTPNMVVKVIPLGSAVRTLRHQDASVRFGASVYGSSTDCAFAYPAGMLLTSVGGVSINIRNTGKAV